MEKAIQGTPRTWDQGQDQEDNAVDRGNIRVGGVTCFVSSWDQDWDRESESDAPIIRRGKDGPHETAKP